MAGIEELAGGVVGFFHKTVTGTAVHVDIEDGEKDPHPTEFSETEARILRLVHTDDLAVCRTDQGEGVGGRKAGRIPKKEEQTGQQEGGKTGGNPPTKPKAGTQQGGGGDQEGSCFG
jgi:hypothetical protein